MTLWSFDFPHVVTAFVSVATLLDSFWAWYQRSHGLDRRSRILRITQNVIRIGRANIRNVYLEAKVEELEAEMEEMRKAYSKTQSFPSFADYSDTTPPTTL